MEENDIFEEETGDVKDIRKKKHHLKPAIEVVHRKKRFEHYYHKLCIAYPNKTKEEIRRMMIIEVYDNIEENVVIGKTSYSDYVIKSKRYEVFHKDGKRPSKSYFYNDSWLRELPVLNYVKTKGTDDEPCYIIRLKYLPREYVFNILYLKGFVTESIYDRIVTSKQKDESTVISKEAWQHFEDFMNHVSECSSTKIGIFDRMFLELKDLCKVPIKLKESYNPDGTIGWYILSKENKRKRA